MISNVAMDAIKIHPLIQWLSQSINTLIKENLTKNIMLITNELQYLTIFNNVIQLTNQADYFSGIENRPIKYWQSEI